MSKRSTTLAALTVSETAWAGTPARSATLATHAARTSSVKSATAPATVTVVVST
jgi:hypothetical protein